MSGLSMTSIDLPNETEPSATSSVSVSSANNTPNPTSASSASNKRASVRQDPFAYLNQYKTDTHLLQEKHADAVIVEPEYTAEEKKLMEELRVTVAAMLKDPSKMVATADDYPGGMHQHWTTYWPQGKDHPQFVDTVSAQDADSSLWPEHELIRFLRARDMNIKKAVKMYFNYKRWRIVFGASHIGTFKTMPFEPLIVTILSHSYHKFDKRGRPIYIQRSGLIDPHRFTTEMQIPQFGIGHTWFTEEMRKRCVLGSKMTGKRVNEIVNIIDIKGLGLGARKLLKVFSTTSYIDQYFSPETLGSMYIINAPSFFPVIYSICKTFLSAKTQEKVKILGKNYAATLVEDLGAEALPVEFGGTCQCEGGCCPYATGPGVYKAPGEDVFDEETVTIKAGAEHVVEIPYMPSVTYVEEEADDGVALETTEAQEVFWSIELAAKDIDVSIELRPSQDPDANTDSHSRSSKSTSTATSAASVAPATSTTSSTTASTLPPIQVQPVTRIAASSTGPILGTYSGTTAGILRLTFSNAYSRWNSKQVKIRSGVRTKKN